MDRQVIDNLKTHIEQVVSHYWCEFNDEETRTGVMVSMFPYLNNLVADGYKILQVCDEWNNTPEIVDNNELYYDVYIREDDKEWLHIRAVMRPMAVDFQEIRPA
jgi:hypothetical protein